MQRASLAAIKDAPWTKDEFIKVKGVHKSKEIERPNIEFSKSYQNAIKHLNTDTHGAKTVQF